MECTRIRELLSAALDGEATPDETAASGAHLERCAACRAWLAAAESVTRLARVEPAGPVPDLTAPILEAARLPAPPSTAPLRALLVVVAFTQLVLAVPVLLFGHDVGAPVHVAHELGSWDVALAVGFLFAAWRPTRAAGMVPLVATLVACLVATAAFDLADGRAAAFGETQHLLEIVGLALLWLLARPLGRGVPRRPGAVRAA